MRLTPYLAMTKAHETRGFSISNCERLLSRILRDPNRMMNSGTSFDVEKGVARKDRTHGQTLTTR